MKITIYKCDNCGKLLSDPSQDIGLRHISCSFDTYSGWVERKKELNMWQHFIKVQGIKQFCNSECLKRYFQNLLLKKENYLKRSQIKDKRITK